MKHLSFYLAVVIIGTALNPVSVEGQQPSRGTAGFRLVEGSWSWARADSTCLGSQYDVTFSEDWGEMVMTEQTATGEPTASISRYRVLRSGFDLSPRSPFVIRVEAVGETRRTDTGELVMWDIIVASPGRLYWRRTDWPLLGSTSAMIRCDGNTPLDALPVRPEQPVTETVAR